MKLAFYLAAAAMVAVALALLLVPLLREGRRHGRSRGVFALALGIALLLPLGAGALYLHIGAPVALDGVPAAAKPMDFGQALTELRAHLRQQPGDAQGWTLLAEATTALKQPDEARDAWDHALKIDPNNVAAMVGWAETDSMARGDHLIEGRALDLLQHALELQPDSQRALWLLGISQFQHARYADAAATWRKLQPLLEPASSVAGAVAEQIANADARAGIKPAAEPAPATRQDAALKVEVSLAPTLKDKLQPGDQLYVYARAVSGPPMPLAVAKLAATTLPATVTLTDAMAMTPELKLSSVARVLVAARISHSGEPIAQPGDLEGSAGIVDTDRKTPITIAIDKVH
ncbi:tetratricopeptide repeat protein [Rhodanobacter geophilus]|uniref:Tetratricopeptide repeat protein n=1 Tax=Rhodanobacter geophilus TaxID=3162488 RepID=A0ABV3QLK9_9GAMM